LKPLKSNATDRVATLWMNRPKVFNAFNEQLIAELHQACLQLDADPRVRVLVLGGRGKHFSSRSRTFELDAPGGPVDEGQRG
jgi:methylglutaconyl-CoA hydratase